MAWNKIINLLTLALLLPAALALPYDIYNVDKPFKRPAQLHHNKPRALLPGLYTVVSELVPTATLPTLPTIGLGTGSILPTGILKPREAEKVALKNRQQFESPRRRDSAHQYPNEEARKHLYARQATGIATGIIPLVTGLVNDVVDDVVDVL